MATLPQRLPAREGGCRRPRQTRTRLQNGATGVNGIGSKTVMVPLRGRILSAAVVTALPIGPSTPARTDPASPMGHRRFTVTFLNVALCAGGIASYTARYFHAGPINGGVELGKRWAGCEAGSPGAMLGGGGACRFIVRRSGESARGSKPACAEPFYRLRGLRARWNRAPSNP